MLPSNDLFMVDSLPFSQSILSPASLSSLVLSLWVRP